MTAKQWTIAAKNEKTQVTLIMLGPSSKFFSLVDVSKNLFAIFIT